MPSLSNGPWKVHARQWSSVGQPLRPGVEDIALTSSAVSEWLLTTQRTAPTLIIMGVTPELCGLPIGSISRFIAVDKSAEMIANVWRPRPGLSDTAICADWRQMPLAQSSVDLALGDGCLCLLEFPSDYASMFRELRRVLRPGGRCVLRCFMRPDEQETVEKVFADLHNGGIGNFHVLKWRLLMALQADAEEGVAVKGAWSIINETWPDLHLLARRFDWPVEQVLTISAYRNVETRYAFPTRTQFCEFFTTAGFSVMQLVTQSYELGERCPTFVLERLGSEASGFDYESSHSGNPDAHDG